MDYGKGIKSLRERLGMTRSELSELAGFSPCYVSLVERNKKRMSLQSLEAFAKALSASVPELVVMSASSEEEIEDIEVFVRDKVKMLESGEQ